MILRTVPPLLIWNVGILYAHMQGEALGRIYGQAVLALHLAIAENQTAQITPKPTGSRPVVGLMFEAVSVEADWLYS